MQYVAFAVAAVAPGFVVAIRGAMIGLDKSTAFAGSIVVVPLRGLHVVLVLLGTERCFLGVHEVVVQVVRFLVCHP